MNFFGMRNPSEEIYGKFQICLHFFTENGLKNRAGRGKMALNLSGRGNPMVDIVLVEPEIPNNTGAIARTCACTGARLHLVKPLGFDISDKAVKRAGLDYWYLVDISVYENIDEYFEKNGDENLWLLTTKAARSFVEADLSAPRVTLMFGKETKGLPEWLRARYADRCLRIPMRAEARSLNLSNSAAILCYETLRQQGELARLCLQTD